MRAQTDSPAGRGAGPGPGMRLWIPAALAALIVLGLWSPNLMRPPPPAWTEYKSAKGQIRRVLLTDKSLLRLNGASQVRVVFEDRDRRLDIGQAEAAVLMQADPRRPFLISAGGREARIAGGEVNVLRQTTQSSAATTLTVRQGQAYIYAVGQAANGLRAGPGDEVSWTDGQPAATVRKVNAANAFAWESHRLAYDKAPLSEVIADLNRYVARPIRIADPAVAALPFTGVLTLEGEGVMLRKIGQALPVDAHPSAAEIVLQRRVLCGGKACPRPARRRKPNALVQSLMKMGESGPAPAPHLLPVPPPPPRAPAPAAAPNRPQGAVPWKPS